MASSKDSVIKQLGSEEAYKEYMRKIGSKGGQAKVPKGKYHKKIDRISRRAPKQTM